MSSNSVPAQPTVIPPFKRPITAGTPNPGQSQNTVHSKPKPLSQWFEKWPDNVWPLLMLMMMMLVTHYWPNPVKLFSWRSDLREDLMVIWSLCAFAQARTIVQLTLKLQLFFVSRAWWPTLALVFILWSWWTFKPVQSFVGKLLDYK